MLKSLEMIKRFREGIENDFLNFNSAVEATITISEKKGHLIV